MTQKGFEDAIRVGSLVGGKFRVEKRIGAGGMGVVLAARHVDLDELVALKVMRPFLKEKAEGRVRFMREAKAMFGLTSEHVGRVFDIGTLESGEPYMVMEYLRGTTLEAMLPAGFIPSIDETLKLLMQVCEAVGEAHTAGIIHRDLKPDNVFVTRRPNGEPHAKVIDFGLSKGESDPNLTGKGFVVGTPRYLAFEHFSGVRAATPRSDIWSLGVIAYRMVTGTEAFGGTTTAEVMQSVQKRTPPAPKDVAPDVDAELSALVMRCIEKDPDARFEDANALRTALAAIATSRRSSQRITAPRPQLPTIEVEEEIAPKERSERLERLAQTIRMSGHATAIVEIEEAIEAGHTVKMPDAPLSAPAPSSGAPMSAPPSGTAATRLAVNVPVASTPPQPTQAPQQPQPEAQRAAAAAGPTSSRRPRSRGEVTAAEAERHQKKAPLVVVVVALLLLGGAGLIAWYAMT
jgi:serine/threonine-protein kinase